MNGRMALSCPVEFCTSEILRDSSGHMQVYLTFFNLGIAQVDGLSAQIALQDKQGESVMTQPLRCAGIDAKGREAFTLSMAGEGLPSFLTVQVTIEEVFFASGEAWVLREEELRDGHVEVLPPGEARNALIGMAGEDARCFAVQQDGVWVCVCGRLNEDARATCFRCRREKQDVFAWTPRRVRRHYRQKMEAEDEAREAERKDAQQQARFIRMRRRKEFARRFARQRNRKLVACIVAWAAVAVIFLGVFVLPSLRPKSVFDLPRETMTREEG